MESDTDETSCIWKYHLSETLLSYTPQESNKNISRICPHRKVVRVVGLYSQQLESVIVFIVLEFQAKSVERIFFHGDIHLLPIPWRIPFGLKLLIPKTGGQKTCWTLLTWQRVKGSHRNYLLDIRNLNKPLNTIMVQWKLDPSNLCFLSFRFI